jgi:Protein of unknown function (DUF3305)
MSEQQGERQVQADSFPVSVIMESREARQGPWTFPQWRVVGVVAGANAGQAESRYRIIHSADGQAQYLWPGYAVKLYKDSAESYWYNLVGAHPSLFVICREDEETGLAPLTVSANYDEANACLETDGTVLTAPIPPEIYQWLERYVVENYTPQEPKKRKRVNWTEDEKGRDQGTPFKR